MTDTIARASAIVDREPRCWRCRCLLAEVAQRPWLMKCRKCKAKTASPPVHARTLTGSSAIQRVTD